MTAAYIIPFERHRIFLGDLRLRARGWFSRGAWAKDKAKAKAKAKVGGVVGIPMLESPALVRLPCQVVAVWLSMAWARVIEPAGHVLARLRPGDVDEVIGVADRIVLAR